MDSIIGLGGGWHDCLSLDGSFRASATVTVGLLVEEVGSLRSKFSSIFEFNVRQCPDLSGSALSYFTLIVSSYALL